MIEELQNYINISEHKSKPVYMYKLKLVYTLVNNTQQISIFGYYASKKLANDWLEYFNKSRVLPDGVKNIEAMIEREILFIEY